VFFRKEDIPVFYMKAGGIPVQLDMWDMTETAVLHGTKCMT
jgi:hypothetical protein